MVPLSLCVYVAVCLCLSVSVCVSECLRRCLRISLSLSETIVPLYLAVSVASYDKHVSSSSSLTLIVCLSILLSPSSVVQPGIGQCQKQVAILKEIKEVASGAFHAAVLRYVIIYFLRSVIFSQLSGAFHAPGFRSVYLSFSLAVL